MLQLSVLLSSLLAAAPVDALEALSAAATPADFSHILQAPISVDGISAAVDLSEGVHIDIAYELEGVGQVRLAAYGQLDGWATFILLVDDITILDLGGELTDLSEQTWISLNREYLATLRHQDAVSLFNSLVQIWRTAEVEQALTAAAESAPPRSVVCDIAGGLSGGAIGGAAGAGCWWYYKKIKPCKKVGLGVAGYIFDYIKDKCEGAQN